MDFIEVIQKKKKKRGKIMTLATNSAQQNQGRATKKKEINADRKRLELSDFFFIIVPSAQTYK